MNIHGSHQLKFILMFCLYEIILLKEITVKNSIGMTHIVLLIQDTK